VQKQTEKKNWLFRSSYLKKAFMAGMISSPFVIYTAVAMYTDDYLSAWTAQNVLPSPHWVHYLIGYGLVLPFAVLGIQKIISTNRSWGLFLACWVIAFPFLISAPIPTQRRLAEGIWVILITGVFGYINDRKVIPLFGKALMGLLFPTMIVILWGASIQASLPSSPLFILVREVEAYLYLKEIAPPNSLVLSSFEVGNSLPAWAPVRVVQGHGPETIHLADWQARINEAFFSPRDQEDCEFLLKDSDLNYLFWGPEEENLWNWDPDLNNCLNQVYNSGDYKIYRVTD
jgi:hypothetical protein